MGIRVVLGGEHVLFLDALAVALEVTDGIEVLDTEASYEGVLPSVSRFSPDVLLLQIGGPCGDAMSIASDVRAQEPSCGVAMMMEATTAGLVDRAVAAGVHGVIPMNTGLPKLIATVRGVAAGCVTVEPSLMRRPRPTAVSLSVRETEVLRLTAGGASLKEIAAQLYLAGGTVRNVASASIKKLGGRNRFDAARIAAEQGWI